MGTDALVQASTSSVSAQPVVRLAQVDILRLRIPVPESLASNVHVGTSADIAVQGTGEHFTGKIARSTGALDRATRTEQVEIDVPNDKLRLAPGMFANVLLGVEEHSDVRTIPPPAAPDPRRSGHNLVVRRRWSKYEHSSL